MKSEDEDEEEELVAADRREDAEEEVEEEAATEEEEEEVEEEEEEVDETELEAFLDGQLADALPFLQEAPPPGVAAENLERGASGTLSSKGEEALRTRELQLIKGPVHPNNNLPPRESSETMSPLCVPVAMLKQALFSHISTEAEEETEGVHEAVVPERPPQGRASTSSHREDPRPPAGLAELPQTPEHNGEAPSSMTWE